MRSLFLICGAWLMVACGLGFNPDLPSADKGSGASDDLFDDSPTEGEVAGGDGDAGNLDVVTGAEEDTGVGGGPTCEELLGGAGGIAECDPRTH